MPTVFDICFNNVVIGGTGGPLSTSMYYYGKNSGQQLVSIHPEKKMLNQDLINILPAMLKEETLGSILKNDYGVVGFDDLPSITSSSEILHQAVTGGCLPNQYMLRPNVC